ncbi:MAG: M20 family metallopeptidase [Firmicutes bacterium]|nr:M20 family metallopeptidase [Bacillota bacterium]
MHPNEVVKNAEELYPQFIKDLEVLVNTDSGSRDLVGLQKVVDYLVPRLEALGCTTSVDWHDEYGPFLTARKKGKGTSKILFLAHLDTVWEPGTAAERPFSIKGDYAYGPGVNDCRSGILCQCYVLKVLHELGFEDYGELILVFNSDEELGSKWSGEKIAELSKEADVALIMEGPTFPDEFITSRAGTMNYTIDVTGRSMHSGVAPEQGRNAILELAHKLIEVQKLDEIDGVRVNLATVCGGEKQGIVAGHASADIDFRINDWDAVQAVKDALPQIMDKCTVEGTVTKWEGDVGHPPFPEHPESGKFTDLVKECGSSIGLTLSDQFCGGASDASYTALGGAVTIDGLPPWGTLYHTPREYLDLTTIVPRVSLVSCMVIKISQEKKYWVRSGK